MLILAVKFIIVIFFGYIAFDAHQKTKNLLKEAKDLRFNKNVLEARARKERIRSIIYSIITLALLATVFFKTGIE